ncbi:MAG: hypothetical protein AB2A00_35705 [Myxococcota bacterium]
MRKTLLIVPLLFACELPAAEEGLDDLQAPLGGFDFRREEPLFGPAHREQFIQAGESEVLQASTVAPRSAAAGDTALWVGWGHFLADRTDDEVADWTGTLSVEEGTLSLLRTIKFDRNDRILPAPDERTVAFESRTRPHFDGLVTRASTTGSAPAPVTLMTRNGAFHHTPGSTALVEETDLGNGVRVAFVSVPLSEEVPCAHAVVGGRWRGLERGDRRRGVTHRLLGRWFTPEGELVGHWRAFAGQRQDGTRVFFGKVINPDGDALALLKGTVTDGVATVDVLDASEAVVGTLTLNLPLEGGAPGHTLSVANLSACLAAP